MYIIYTRISMPNLHHSYANAIVFLFISFRFFTFCCFIYIFAFKFYLLLHAISFVFFFIFCSKRHNLVLHHETFGVNAGWLECVFLWKHAHLWCAMHFLFMHILMYILYFRPHVC